MLPIVTSIAIGGVITGLMMYKRRKPCLLDVLSKPAAFPQQNLTVLDNIENSVIAWDNRYQSFVRQRIDPLLSGKNRAQFFQLLSAGREVQLSSDQKIINRKLLLGVTSLKFLAVGLVIGVNLAPLVLAVGLYLSWPIYKTAYEMAKQHQLSTIHLIAVYFSVLWVKGYYALGTLSFLIGVISQKVLRICEDTTHYELSHRFYQQPSNVWVYRDGVELEIAFDQLQAGEIMVLTAGQIIPADGKIVEGLATIDQRMLTGEALPIDKGVGDFVLAPTLILTGHILVEVEKAGSETLAAQLDEIITRNYRQNQLSVEARSMAIADRALIPMLSLSALSIPFVGLKGAIAVLGSNFTMNMIWLRLLTLINFINVASKHNILVKNAGALEQLQKIDTIIFDKTGTLTSEHLEVVAIHAYHQWPEEQILLWAAIAEHKQIHPIAKAILALAKKRQLEILAVDETEYEIGFGIKVMVQGRAVWVGSRRFITEMAIDIPASSQEIENHCNHQGHSLVYVVVDRQLVGMIELKAALRPEAIEVVTSLHNQGLKLWALSGDTEMSTKALAYELGIDYVANTLPEDKADFIAELQAKGHKVAFIGDGINDTVALQQADVAISLTGATLAATDTAQIILMQGHLKQLLTLLELAKSLDSNINHNFNWATGLSLVSVGGVIFFHGGFLMVELMAAMQIFQGIVIASEPLLEQRTEKNTPKLAAL